MAGWKMDGDNISMQDGHPVWEYDDGKTSPLDVGSTLATLKNTTAESVSRKNTIRDMEAKYSPFTGIEDPADYVTRANTALDTVKNFDDKKFIDAGEVDKVKKEVSTAYEQQLSGVKTAHETLVKEYQEKLEKSETSISTLLIEGEISRSKFLPKNTYLSPEAATSIFKDNFTIGDHNGKATAIGVKQNGEKIMSLKDPGSFASVDEALEILLMERNDKDTLLKGIDGGGNAPPNGHRNGSADISKMSPTEKLNYSRGIK